MVEFVNQNYLCLNYFVPSHILFGEKKLFYIFINYLQMQTIYLNLIIIKGMKEKSYKYVIKSN